LKGDYLHTAVKNKIIGTMDVGYTDEVGIKEVAGRSDEILGQLEIKKEKELVKEFIDKISSKGLAISGEESVKTALENGQVKRVLLSEKLELEKVEELSNLAEKTHAEVEMVSTETQEGEQFYQAFRGIGAILRYRI
jgi:peptide chain release factor subunit 1